MNNNRFNRALTYIGVQAPFDYRRPRRQKMIFLDANATTSPTPQVVEAVVEAMRGMPANPSSVHQAGATARSSLERARDDICSLIDGALPEGVVFNSGGTEGNNAVLRGIPGATIVTTAVEHPSVLEVARRGSRLVVVPVSTSGVVAPQQIVDALPPEGPVVVSVQWANSETGVIQPIADIVATIRAVRPDAFIHVDAAQAVGRIPVSVQGLDAVTCSGHKLHGPGGTGVLVLSDPDDERVQALLVGGGQERGRRSGTPNVPGAIGLGAAFRSRQINFEADTALLKQLRDGFEQKLLSAIPGTRVNGGQAPRIPNTLSLLIPSIDATALVARLDQEGICCSVGSACSSGKPEPSHVLLAMGLSEDDAYASVRFSFSILNTREEADRAAQIVIHTVREIR